MPYEKNEEVNEMFFSSIPQSKLLINNREITNDPYLLFQEIFINEFLKNLTQETNRYYEQRKLNAKINRNWSAVSAKEMKAFLGVLLLMCLNKKCALSDHFSDNPFIASKVKEIIN